MSLKDELINIVFMIEDGTLCLQHWRFILLFIKNKNCLLKMTWQWAHYFNISPDNGTFLKKAVLNKSCSNSAWDWIGVCGLEHTNHCQHIIFALYIILAILAERGNPGYPFECSCAHVHTIHSFTHTHTHTTHTYNYKVQTLLSSLGYNMSSHEKKDTVHLCVRVHTCACVVCVCVCIYEIWCHQIFYPKHTKKIIQNQGDQTL